MEIEEDLGTSYSVLRLSVHLGKKSLSLTLDAGGHSFGHCKLCLERG